MRTSELLKAASGEPINFSDNNCGGISIDSRTIKEGEAFLAIKGDKFDGHNYIDEAVEKGAVCVITEKAANPAIPVIVVKDTLKALGDIAHFHRKKFDIPLIAVTGSSGKTSTKELTAHILSDKFNVLKTEGTRNNLIGLPLTLLGMNEKHDVCVVELGTNKFGEIKRLSEIAAPDAGVITNIGDSHLEFLRSRDGVFEEKSALLASLDGNCHAVLNKDDIYLKNAKTKAEKIYFSVNNKSDYQARDITTEQNSISFKLNKVKFTVHIPGPHNVYNALAAVICGEIMGLRPNEIADILGSYTDSLLNRMAIEKHGKITIINDTYNSNPLSFKAAIETLAMQKGYQRKIIITSDMLELGERAQEFHSKAGEEIALKGIDAVYTVGNMAAYISKSAAAHGLSEASAVHFPAAGELIKSLKNIARNNDIILVKGSRATHMEDIVDELKNIFGQEKDGD